jgi:hypothetical protein
VTEAECQQHAREFVKQLKNSPQVGKRPFGYPKGAWWRSGAWGCLGLLLLLPRLLLDGFERWHVIAAVAGAILFCCAFTMRVVAFTTAASGVVDGWLIERVQVLGKQTEDKATAAPGTAPDTGRR